MILLLHCLQLLCCDYHNITLSIDIPKEIASNEIVMIEGKLSNESENTISFWDFELFKSLYRGDNHWNIIICKEGQQYFIPSVIFGKRGNFPKIIKLKKHEKYSFQIPITFKELSTDGFLSINDVESGYYEVQLTVSLKKPKNIDIKSNIIKFRLNVKD